jgi:aspartate-semialdehyde dehydrogenase
MRVGIVGVTGVVGEEFIKLINERNFNFTSIKIFASEKSIGKKYEIKNNIYIVEKFNENYLIDLDLIFLFVSKELSFEIANLSKKYNCKIIDNSSAFRLSHPLIIPEIFCDKNDLSFKDSNIIANPNCSTILLCMILYPLSKISKIKKLVVTTFQAVSGAGINGINELKEQIKNINSNLDIKPKYFNSQCINNVFSHDTDIDIISGNNEEENKIINETKKILNDNSIDISATCIRVPVVRSHCESVNITFENSIEKDTIIETLSNFPGVKILNDEINNKFPESIISENKNDIYVGRIRINKNNDKNLNLFLSGDQVRKGAALNAIQIAEYIYIYN